MATHTPPIRLAIIVAAALTAGCPRSVPHREPVSTTKPVQPSGGLPPPATLPAADAAGQDTDQVEVRISTLADPQSGWLRIEGIRATASGAWATGSILGEHNKIVIDTENVGQFSIDLSRCHLDWTRRVVLRIDGRSSELTRKPHPVVHLRRSPAGSWDVIEP